MSVNRLKSATGKRAAASFAYLAVKRLLLPRAESKSPFRVMPKPLPPHQQAPSTINLVPQEEGPTSSPRGFLNWLLSAGRYLLIITELLLFSAFISRFYFDDRIQDQIDKGIKPRLETVDYLHKNEVEFKNLQARINNIKSTLNSRLEIAKIVDELIKLTPTGARLEKIQIDEKEILFSASIPSIEVLEVFKNNFAKSKVFRSLDIADLFSTKDTGLITFKATSTLQRAKAASRSASAKTGGGPQS